jgi:hypothetical protein
MVTWYQQLIGMLQLVTELGRIDVLFEVSNSQRTMLCKERDISSTFIMCFITYTKLEQEKLSLMINEVRQIVSTEWSDFPKLMRKSLQIKITWFVDASHVGC